MLRQPWQQHSVPVELPKYIRSADSVATIPTEIVNYLSLFFAIFLHPVASTIAGAIHSQNHAKNRRARVRHEASV
jgi:hypothetical protein